MEKTMKLVDGSSWFLLSSFFLVILKDSESIILKKGGAEMKKTDIILAVAAIIAAAGIWLFYSAGADKGLTAVVTVDGELREELNLKENERVAIDTLWGFNIVETKDGQVFVTEADCRDQICVDHKKIEKVGETIVCLPHKMVVEIVGEGEAEADMVVG